MAIKDTFNTKINPNLPYMTGGEAQLFKAMRDSGRMTIYRCTLCVNCGVEIPKPKEFCSIECMKGYKQGDGGQ